MSKTFDLSAIVAADQNVLDSTMTARLRDVIDQQIAAKAVQSDVEALDLKGARKGAFDSVKAVIGRILAECISDDRTRLYDVDRVSRIAETVAGEYRKLATEAGLPTGTVKPYARMIAKLPEPLAEDGNGAKAVNFETMTAAEANALLLSPAKKVAKDCAEALKAILSDNPASGSHVLELLTATAAIGPQRVLELAMRGFEAGNAKAEPEAEKQPEASKKRVAKQPEASKRRAA